MSHLTELEWDLILIPKTLLILKFSRHSKAIEQALKLGKA